MTAIQIHDPAVAILPTAAALAVAVADYDDTEIARILAGLERDQMDTLVVVLAGHVHLDAPLLAHPPDAADATVNRAVVASARRFGVAVERIMSRDRHREVAEARQAAAYAARLSGLSYSAIGRGLALDHTTVMHACVRVGESPRLRRAATRVAVSLGWTRAST
jgi:hypothetical protein